MRGQVHSSIEWRHCRQNSPWSMLPPSGKSKLSGSWLMVDFCYLRAIWPAKRLAAAIEREHKGSWKANGGDPRSGEDGRFSRESPCARARCRDSRAK